MEKKLEKLSDVFITSRKKKEKEVLASIKKYCMQIEKADIAEIHENAVQYFGLTEQDTYYDIDRFWQEIQDQKKLKEEVENSN